jgi:hypothetical protein
MKDKIIPFPIAAWQRSRNRLGPSIIPDELSGRIINFGDAFETDAVGIGRAVFVDIMSEPDEDLGKPSRKMCRMLLSVRELRRMVDILEAHADEKGPD